MSRATGLVITLINFAILCAVLWLFRSGSWQPVSGGGAIEYKDFVSILLTVLGLMIAILAAVLTFAALYGFDMIRREAVSNATSEANKVAREQAESVAARVADAYLSQKVPTHSYETGDYGKAAGGDDGRAV